MSFWRELRQRNVFRATLAYAVFAWLLLQVVEFVLEVVGSPDWVLRVLVVLAAAGLPAVAVFSWAFEITPEGIKRESDVDRSASIRPETGRRLNQITMVSLVVLVAFLLADKITEPDDVARPVPAAEPAAPATEAVAHSRAETAGDAEAQRSEPQASIAVLPFTNMSPDPDNEYFADGISEELLNVLVDIESLRVPSRTSSFAFKDANTDIREIAAALEVGHVLEGSVRKAGNQVRITAQLIDVSTDTHLWSETYDRELEDIFAIQDEIAGHIAEALKVALDLDENRQPTEDLEAYTLYLQARELLRNRHPEGLMEAERLLGIATERDPGFAEAWAARAMVQVVLPGYVKDDHAKFQDAVRAYAEQSLALDPDNPEAMMALAQISNVSGDNARALHQFQDLVERHPRHSTARLWYAIALFKAGYLAKAHEQAEAGLRLDPAYATMLDWYARIAHPAGHPERVVERANRAIDLGRSQGRVALHQHFIDAGNAKDLEPWLVGEHERLWGWMRMTFEVRDNPAALSEALALADEAERAGVGFIAEYMRVNFLMAGEDSDAFFEQVRRVQGVDDTVNTIVWLPGNTHHRDAPAMHAWARDMGYLSLWRERGWPDLCRPLGDDDFECD